MAVDWEIGALYIKPNGPGGYWTQPGGVGTTVFPQQVQANSNILTTEPFTELSGNYVFGCGHSQNMGTIYVDTDGDGTLVALIACSLCSFVQRYISPASDALGPSTAASLQNAILFP